MLALDDAGSLDRKALQARARFSMSMFRNQFDVLEFADYRVMFDLGPTEDERGIGRVSRSLHEALRRRCAWQRRYTSSVHSVYFFPSIHWCPDILPDRSIVTIHDTIPLSLRHFFPERQDEWFYDHGAVATQAERIVTSSRSSRDDISKHLLVEPRRISIVYNGITELGRPHACQQVHIPKIPFVTFLGAGGRHKNIDIVLNALALNSAKDIAFAIIGSACEDVIDRARLWGLNPELVFPLGRLGDDAISTVLAKSVALVMPSLHEGFGLPPFEAALLGVPSICSDRPALNELLEDAALFVHPFLPRDWLAAIRTLQSDRTMADEIARKAGERARALTWDRAAQTLAGIFAEVAEEIV